MYMFDGGADARRLVVLHAHDGSTSYGSDAPACENCQHRHMSSARLLVTAYWHGARIAAQRGSGTATVVVQAETRLLASWRREVLTVDEVEGAYGAVEARAAHDEADQAARYATGCVAAKGQ